MKRAVAQIIGILLIAATAAWITRMVSKPIERAVACDASTLKPGEICLSSVIERWKSNVLWVDARPLEEWQRDGVPGSVWITHDRFDESLANVATQILEGKPLIVYCSAIGCDTSKEVAIRIRSFGLATEVHALHGGWKALKQAGMTK